MANGAAVEPFDTAAHGYDQEFLAALPENIQQEIFALGLSPAQLANVVERTGTRTRFYSKSPYSLYSTSPYFLYNTSPYSLYNTSPYSLYSTSSYSFYITSFSSLYST